MKCPTKSTIKERYDWLLNSCDGSYEKLQELAQAELKLQQNNKAQDHPKIKRNISKIKEIINYGKSQQNKK